MAFLWSVQLQSVSPGGSLTWALPAESLKGTNGKETVADSGKLVISNNSDQSHADWPYRGDGD